MRRTVGVLCCLALGSCEPLCACSPPTYGIVVAGNLLSAEGGPVATTQVRAEVGHISCNAFSGMWPGVVTAPSGEFAMELEYGASDSACVRLFVRDAASGPAELSLPARYRVQFGGWPYDTLRVNVSMP